MTTVLVTGGSGFIGTHVCRMLTGRGDRVINFDLHPRNGPLAWLAGEAAGEVFEPGDASDAGRLAEVISRYRPLKIVHTAASIDLPGLEARPTDAYVCMLGATVNILEAMRCSGFVERMVNFSSIGVLPAPQYQPIDCNHPTLMAAEGPASGIYGAGKLAGEAFCRAYTDAYGLDVVQLRPSATYGFLTANPIQLNAMLEGALRGEPVRLSHGGSLPRDYTHVHDVAGITLAALDAPSDILRSRCFYAASGMNPLITPGVLAGIVREMVPSADIEIGDSMDPHMERNLRRMRGVLDVTAVENELGYRIRYRDVREGLREYADTYSAWLVSQGIRPAARV